MGINSSLYRIKIWHDRQSPKQYSFEHDVFMFYLDLDELGTITQYSRWMGHNQYRIYNFCEHDHIRHYPGTLKDNIKTYVRAKGLNEEVDKVFLLTNVRFLGYVFNPVSFYFCFNRGGQPLCVVPEIGNTFGELKYFYLGADTQQEKFFKDNQTKYYYISPFTDLDNTMAFKIAVPDRHLSISIDVLKDGKKYFYSSMQGERLDLSNKNLMLMTVAYPFITLKVIFLIYWHAAVLHFIKRISHQAKEANPHLQREVFKKT